MEQTLGAYYQCHKNPTSFLRCIKSFQKYYPGSSITVLNDGGYDYSDFCMRYNIRYKYCPKTSNIRGSLCFGTKASAIDFITKIWTNFQNIKEDYFILLEDDVRILKRHSFLFEYDINGCNTNESLPIFMRTILQKRGHSGALFYGGCGGTVLSKKFLGGIELINIINLIHSFPDTFELGSDMLLSFIVLYFGGSVGQHPEFAEMWYPNVNELLRNNVVFSLHQYKAEYDSSGEKMTELERLDLNYKI